MVAAWGRDWRLLLSFDSFKLVKPAARSNVVLISREPNPTNLEHLLSFLLLSTSSLGHLTDTSIDLLTEEEEEGSAPPFILRRQSP